MAWDCTLKEFNEGGPPNAATAARNLRLAPRPKSRSNVLDLKSMYRKTETDATAQAVASS